MQIKRAPTELEQSLQDFRAKVAFAQQTSQTALASEEFSITNDDIVIDYYFGRSALGMET